MMEKKDKYAIRKLTTGAASVLIGVALFGAAGTQVKADNMQASSQEPATQTVSKSTQAEPDSDKQEPAEPAEPASQSTPKTNSDLTKSSVEDNSKQQSNGQQESQPKQQSQNSDKQQNESNKPSQAKALGNQNTATGNNSINKNPDQPTTPKQPTKPTQATETFNLSDLKNNTIPAKSIAESKIKDTDSYTTTVTSKEDPSKTYDIYTGQDTTVNFKITVPDSVTSVTQDNPIIVKIINDNNDDKNINDENKYLQTFTTIKSNDTGWKYKYDEKLGNAFDIWFDKPTPDSKPTYTTFSISFHGTNTVQEGKKTVQIATKITYPNSKSEIKPIFTVNYNPLGDKVDKAEILKGFKMLQTTLSNEKGNIERNIGGKNGINTYKQLVNINPNQPVLQWGMYFNYGNNAYGSSLNPLEDAIFRAHFSDDQIFLPSSIKVFKVPKKYISDGNGNRYGINDIPVGETSNVYHLITSSPEDTAFENYLASCSNNSFTNPDSDPNGFGVNQGKGKNNPFKVPEDNSDCSKYAYFIQVDTVLKDPSKKPGTKTTLDTFDSATINGKGDSYKYSAPWTNPDNDSGGGSSTIKNKEQAIIRYYDDDTGQYIGESSENKDFSSKDFQDSNNGNTSDSITFNNDNNIRQAILNKGYKYAQIIVTSGSKPQGPELKDQNGNPITGGTYGKYDDSSDKLDGSDSQPQYFIVHFKHGTQEGNPVTETKHIIEEIHYVPEDDLNNWDNENNQLKDPYKSPITITFTRVTKTYDTVTGNPIFNSTTAPWNISINSFSAVPNLQQITDKNGAVWNIDNTKSEEFFNNVLSNLANINDASEVGEASFIHYDANKLNDDKNNKPGNKLVIVIPYVKKGQTTSPQQTKPQDSKPQPTKPQNSVPPTTPTPQQPTQPTKPTQPTELSVPTQPSQIVKHVKHNKPPKTVKHIKKNSTDNNKPKSEINKHTHKYSYNTPAKSERVTPVKASKVNNIQPKSNSINQPHHISNATPVQPHSTGSVQPKGNVIIRTAAKAKAELPQTSENQNSNWKLGLLGLTSLAIASIIALFGRGDRRRNN